MPPRMILNKTMSNANFYPARGEILIDETGRVKVGDGIHGYQDLPYVGTAGFDIELDAKTFIEQHVDLIEQNKFNDLYRIMPLSLVDEVTSILHDCGIDILGGE